MVGPGGGPNQDLFFVLMNNAITNTSALERYWSVQRRHADGQRWFDVAHYLTKEDADGAVARAKELHPDVDLRVEHVRRA